MTIIERIAKASFWVTILFIPFAFIVMPLINEITPSLFTAVFSNDVINPFLILLLIFGFSVIFLWVYCLEFWYKNDRYSNSIFLLFAFSGVYAPIYYYRVKIKKRPLINKIEDKINNENFIEESDFNDLTRLSIFGNINLWASINKQLELQKIETETNLLEELFEQWNDIYIVDHETIKEIFSSKELELLNKFDNLLRFTFRKLKPNIPELNQFIKTAEWKEINLFAKEIIMKLNIK